MLTPEKINKIRRLQTIISVTLFILVFGLFWKTTNFEMTDVQLSYWSLEKFGWIWNCCLIMLSISIFINIFYYIEHDRRLIYKNFIQICFLIVSTSLFYTGIFDMNHPIHNIMAYIYFFAYPLSIFLLAHLNRKHFQYKTWETHTIFSMTMIVLPLLSMNVFHGKALPETIHSIIVLTWNLYLLI